MMEYDFIHGDCHYGNFALKEKEYILIDWGCAREKEEKKFVCLSVVSHTTLTLTTTNTFFTTNQTLF